jgi:dimethylargininase
MDAILARAIVRPPGPNFAQGLTASGLGPPDFPLALRQHAEYIATLRRLGLDVIVLDPEPDYPDACFIEDTAVVTPRVAVITNPGAKPRRGEERTVEPVLARFRPIERILSPGTVEGGDVLMVENQVFIGISERTNADGARQLGRILEARGYSWSTVPVGAGLHLKSSVNSLGRRRLAATPELAEHPAFADLTRIVLDAEDAYAANTLWINGRLLMPAGYPRARKKFVELGVPILELEVSEMRKMDGGLTCLSLRF